MQGEGRKGMIGEAGASEMTGPRIAQARGTFSMSCLVEVNIRANADNIWNLLTDATDFPRWNSNGHPHRGSNPRRRATPASRSRHRPHLHADGVQQAHDLDGRICTDVQRRADLRASAA